MPEFIAGVFLIAVGFTGNAGGLLEELAGDGNFVAFGAALGVFYFLWTEIPPPEQKPVRVLISGLALAIIVTQAARIIAALSTAWQAITSLQGGMIANQNVSPASGGSSGLGAILGGAGNLLSGASRLGGAFGGSSGTFSGGGTSSLGGGTSSLGGASTGSITDPGVLTQQLLLDQNAGGTSQDYESNTSGTGGYDFSITNTLTPGGTGGSADSNASASSIGTSGFGNLSAAQIQAESGGQQFNPEGQPLISSAGAVGISQILPQTAQDVAQALGIPYSLSDLEYDPAYNAQLGSAYMGQLLKQFGGNQAVALAAYNAGPNNAGVKLFAATGDASGLPAATASYLTNILGPTWGNNG